MSWEWECYVCGEWADNRVLIGDEFAWYYIWYCDKHAVQGCEKQDAG